MSNRVAVIISVHGDRVSVEKTLISLYLQDFEDWVGLICHFNVSPNVKKLIQHWAQRDNRFQLLEVGAAGLVPPLKRSEIAIKSGNFKYVAIIDSDDTMLPGRLRSQVDFLNKNPNVAGCGGQRIIVDENFNLKLSLQPPYPRSAVVIRNWFAIENPIVHSTLMLRVDIFLKCGGYELAMKYVPDADLYFKIMKISNLQNLRKSLVAYQVDSTRVRDSHEELNFGTIYTLRILLYYCGLAVDYNLLERSSQEWRISVERSVGPLIRRNPLMILLASKAFSEEAKETFVIEKGNFTVVLQFMINLFFRLRVVLFFPRSLFKYAIWNFRWKLLLKSIKRYKIEVEPV